MLECSEVGSDFIGSYKKNKITVVDRTDNKSY